MSRDYIYLFVWLCQTLICFRSVKFNVYCHTSLWRGPRYNAVFCFKILPPSTRVIARFDCKNKIKNNSSRSVGGIRPRKFKVGGLSPRKFKVGGISPRCSVSRGIVPRETNFGKSRGGLFRTFPVADSRGLFTLFSAADPIGSAAEQICSAAVRGGLFYSAREMNLADSAAYLIGPTRT